MKSPILNLASFESTRWVPWRGNTANFLTIHLQARLPYDKPLIRTNYRGNYTTIYVGLPPELINKVVSLAKKQRKKQERTESAALRLILDSYFKIIKKNGIPNEPLRKISPVGLKVLPRTIKKEQDKKLRKIAEQTGWKISELIREAVDVTRIEDILGAKKEGTGINDYHRRISYRGSI